MMNRTGFSVGIGGNKPKKTENRGRPELPEGERKENTTIKLTPYIKMWLKSKPESQSLIIEGSLLKEHKDLRAIKKEIEKTKKANKRTNKSK